MKKAALDIRDAVLSEQGVEDYFCPVMRHKYNNLENELLSIMANHAMSHEDVLRDSLKIAAKFFHGEAMALFLAEKTLIECRANNISPIIRPDWPYIHSLANDINIPQPKYLSVYQAGPLNMPIWKKLFNPKRLWKRFRLSKKSTSASSLVEISKQLRIGKITADTLQNQPVAIETLPLILTHAAHYEGPVHYSRFFELFSPITDNDIKSFDSNDVKKAVESLIHATEELFSQHSVKLSPRSVTYIKNLSIRFLILLMIHQQRLDTYVDKLPQILWAGSCGERWGSLIAAAVKRNGGTVVAHDHAGVGYTVMPAHGFIESTFCDEFFTYTMAHAKSYQSQSSVWEYFGKIPRMTGALQGSGKKYNTVARKKPDKLTIMYVTTIYERDRGRIGVLPPDIARIDFQARHISALAKEYNVIIKPHPESPLDIPSYFHEIPNVTISSEPFMTVYDKADYLIIDYVHTSIFKEAVLTDLPCILLDMEEMEWFGEAEELANNRFVTIPVGFDKNNRAADIMQEIKNALPEAEAKAKDKSFAEYYFL